MASITNSSFTAKVSLAPVPCKIQVPVGITFGQTSNRCRGHGICKMEVLSKRSGTLFDTTPERATCCRGTAAVLEYNAQTGLRMLFTAGDLCPKIIRKQFDPGIFRMEEDFELAGEICAALRISTFCILRGAYLVNRNNNVFYIDFGGIYKKR